MCQNPLWYILRTPFSHRNSIENKVQYASYLAKYVICCQKNNRTKTKCQLLRNLEFLSRNVVCNIRYAFFHHNIADICKLNIFKMHWEPNVDFFLLHNIHVHVLQYSFPRNVFFFQSSADQVNALLFSSNMPFHCSTVDNVC